MLVALAGAYPSMLYCPEDADVDLVLLRMFVGRRWVQWPLAQDEVRLFPRVPWLRDADGDDDVHAEALTGPAMYQHLVRHLARQKIGNPSVPIGSVSDILDETLKTMCDPHYYVSTACSHAIHLRERFGRRHQAQQSMLHSACRETCKYCGATCQCGHHEDTADSRWQHRQESPDIRTRAS